MNKPSKIIHYYLLSMRDSCQRILRYTAEHDYDKFISDTLVRDAVERNFLLLGEASKKIPYKFKKRYPALPWECMYRLRNRIAHEYYDVDQEMLWCIIHNDLSDNLSQLNRLIEEDNELFSLHQ